MEDIRVELTYEKPDPSYPDCSVFPYRPVIGDAVRMPVGDLVVRFRVIDIEIRVGLGPSVPALCAHLAAWGDD